MPNIVHLTTWVAQQTKERFSAIARDEGLSDSGLLKRLAELMLHTARADQGPKLSLPHDGIRPASRVSLRLQPDDLVLLQQRAAARSLRPATYCPF
jgi:hypothetical protein